MASVRAQLLQAIRGRMPTLKWGRVGMGWGGTLAGYNQQLRKKRYDLLSDIYQKQYEAGEISLDKLIEHLSEQKKMPWVSVEEKRLIDQGIKDLRIQQKDETMNRRYEAGEIDAKGMLAYYQTKLATMVPGSPVYERQQATIAEWQKQVNKEDRELFATQEATRVYAQTAGAMTSADYEGLASMYDNLAGMASADNEPQEAAEYQQSAAQARDNAQIQKEREEAEVEAEAVAGEKEARNDLIDKINLAINSYHDETITTARFMALLDEYQTEAVSTGNTDLLLDMNAWVDKAIKGKGTISAAKDGGVGGSPISGTSGMSWDEEDAIYERILRNIQKAFAAGEKDGKLYDATDYASDLFEITAIRKDQVEERTAYLEGLDPEAKTRYDGSKQQNDNLHKKFTAELDEIDSVTLPAAQELATGVGPGGDWSYVVVENERGIPETRLMKTPEGVGTLYMPDETGKLHQIKRELITDLTPDEMTQAQQNQVAGIPTTIERNGKLYRVTTREGRYVAEGGYYVDIWNPEVGQRVRYSKNEETGAWMPESPELQEKWAQTMDRMTDVQKELYEKNPILFSPTGMARAEEWLPTLYGTQKPELKLLPEAEEKVRRGELISPIPVEGVAPPAPKPIAPVKYVPPPTPSPMISGAGGAPSRPGRIVAAPEKGVGAIQWQPIVSADRLTKPEPIPQAPKEWEPIQLGAEYAPQIPKKEEPWYEKAKKAIKQSRLGGLATRLFGW